MNDWTDPVPEPPGRASWGFLEELRNPYPIRPRWTGTVTPPLNALDLGKGVDYCGGFPDKDARLVTAAEDLTGFLEKIGLLRTKGIPILTQKSGDLAGEQFVIRVGKNSISIIAGEPEGIQRGIYGLKDEILASSGPFLQIGTKTVLPWLKNRISRCFFGPIKRPPFHHDELLDDIDYYPDAYLNRLAGEGVNGLWLTIEFRSLCKTTITDFDAEAGARLEKLKRTVAKCLRFGIKTWVFCIEPAALGAEDPLLQRHPELGGAPFGNHGGRYFCPSSQLAQQYLFDSTHWLFSQVPGLGGLLNISHGEAPTTCLSSLDCVSDEPVDCPRCGRIPKWQILHQSLSAMRDGMREAGAEGELISWLYTPTPGHRPSWMFALTSNVPEGVILQYNFESNCQKTQMGRSRTGGDYWLSVPGPSTDFEEVAVRTRNSGTELSAKIQVGCSHEIATIPFVPVPGLLYQKYRAMHETGCAHVMQCWYFGNYPGVMNRAAGLLAADSFQGSEMEFLLRLARPDWGKASHAVVQAWQYFAEGYSQYPLSNMFQYYGPVQDGVVWPLHLKPAMRPLSPSWIPGYPPSGDVIGECLAGFALPEALALCGEMDRKWQQGMLILAGLRSQFQSDPARLLDIGLAEAIGIQIGTAKNILRFYFLRHSLICDPKAQWREILTEMRSIALTEIAATNRLCLLCEEDSRLGFHSEAESHKFYPEKLRWRVRQLVRLIDTEFPEVESTLAADHPFPFPDSGTPVYRCGTGWRQCQRFQWRLDWDQGDLLLRAKCQQTPGQGSVLYLHFLDKAGIRYPTSFMCNAANSIPNSAQGDLMTEVQSVDCWHLELKIPERSWCDDVAGRPAHICFHYADPQPGGSIVVETWPVAPEPLMDRLELSIFDPRYMAYFE